MRFVVAVLAVCVAAACGVDLPPAEDTGAGDDRDTSVILYVRNSSSTRRGFFVQAIGEALLRGAVLDPGASEGPFEVKVKIHEITQIHAESWDPATGNQRSAGDFTVVGRIPPQACIVTYADDRFLLECDAY